MALTLFFAKKDTQKTKQNTQTKLKTDHHYQAKPF